MILLLKNEMKIMKNQVFRNLLEHFERYQIKLDCKSPQQKNIEALICNRLFSMKSQVSKTLSKSFANT